jgi:hypothetical protein
LYVGQYLSNSDQLIAQILANNMKNASQAVEVTQAHLSPTFGDWKTQDGSNSSDDMGAGA